LFCLVAVVCFAFRLLCNCMSSRWIAGLCMTIQTVTCKQTD
jgi:hypothetical protein